MRCDLVYFVRVVLNLSFHALEHLEFLLLKHFHSDFNSGLFLLKLSSDIFASLVDFITDHRLLDFLDPLFAYFALALLCLVRLLVDFGLFSQQFFFLSLHLASQLVRGLVKELLHGLHHLRGELLLLCFPARLLWLACVLLFDVLPSGNHRLSSDHL